MHSSDVARPSGTALVPLRPAERPPGRRVLAPFLAHLIAVNQQAPQTRVRRRAEPDEAIRSYQAAFEPEANGAVFSRSL